MLEETVPASKRSAFCASVIEEGLKEKRRQDAIANLRNFPSVPVKDGKSALDLHWEGDKTWLNEPGTDTAEPNTAGSN